MIQFTVATCTFNAAKELPATLESVLGQEYAEVEHLIIDGASKDDSLDLILKYKRQSDEALNGHDVRIISEPDRGLYDAMNKALGNATGDYILFLNAGDRFHSTDTLITIADVCEQSDTLPGVVYGHTDIVDAQGHFLRKRRLEPPSDLHWTSFRYGMLVCHQAFFASTKLTAACKYDTRYRFSSDFDWCIRLMRMAEEQRLPLVNSGTIIADYLEGGMTKKNHRRSLWERFRIMSEHYGFLSAIRNHLYFVLRAVIKR